MNYFTSDLHFGHGNIIKYCNRPFKTPDDMNNSLIRNWNSRVKEEDTVFHVGDFCFQRSSQSLKAKCWEDKLNGKIIHIKGNHDKNNSTKTVIERLVISMGGRSINLVHKPEHADLSYGLNFVGHVHEKWAFKRIRQGDLSTDCINVGVDVNNFRPVTFNEIMSKYKHWLRNGRKGVKNEI